MPKASSLYRASAVCLKVRLLAMACSAIMTLLAYAQGARDSFKIAWEHSTLAGFRGSTSTSPGS